MPDLPDPFPSDADHADGTPGFPEAMHGPSHPLDSAGDADDEPEGAVPPGYDWPTHGGYLGCLLGLIAACLVGGFVGSSLRAALIHYNWVPGYAVALIVVAVYVVSIVALCYLGWRLGKRFYRSYPQTRRLTWGEHNEYGETEADDGPDVSGGAAGDMTGPEGSASTDDEADEAKPSAPQALPDEPANRAERA